mmetsp:Transcript_779/g.2953  ORF Transcript_779/g.2953 Transcript_779/m.2953 type:complete len:175 (-) Transcript_779:581-1105(-)
MLAAGRRGTTQALLELCWSMGMAIGPFVGGILSDSFHDISCDSGCALAQSLLIIGGLGMSMRGFCHLMAAAHLRDDLKALQCDESHKSTHVESRAEVPHTTFPDFTAGHASTCDVEVDIDEEVSDGEFDDDVAGVAASPPDDRMSEDEARTARGNGLAPNAEPPATAFGRSALD